LSIWKFFPATLTPDGRKVPVKGFKWREDCSSDQGVINSWSTQYPQLKFYGLPTGPDNDLLVLDVDVKSGGLETIKKYNIPITMSQRTRSGGVHYFFKYPKDGKRYGNRAGFDQGLDIRGADGYVIFYGVDNTPICEAPDWFKSHALAVEKEAVNLEDVVKIDPEIVKQKLDESCENIRNAPEGESNNVLNTEAYKIGQLVTSGSVDREHAYNELFNAAKERGKPDQEARATIESGLKGGASNPVISPFGNRQPELLVPTFEATPPERWTPSFFTTYDLMNFSKLKRPQIFKDWSTQDIHLTTADGGTGKTTLKLYEAVCLALGEPFLGHECLLEGGGRTLFVTGEDTAEKLAAMIGSILKQMDIHKDREKVAKIKNNILIKKDEDLCLIDKARNGFITLNTEAYSKVCEAIEDLKPDMIVFDPIASFWGSESALNDMSKIVAKFMGRLVVKSNACVEMINHMGKASSSTKDMTQFAGRGGTALPSHSRVSRVLRLVDHEEYKQLTGNDLTENQSAMMCNVNKFSDGSPLFNEPFLIVREGFLFSKVTVVAEKIKEELDKASDTERVFGYIKTQRNAGRYPNKEIITAHFNAQADKISKERTNQALALLCYEGHMGEMVKTILNPDIEAGGKVYMITDMDGKEVKNA
jgi:hypothetical protein